MDNLFYIFFFGFIAFFIYSVFTMSGKGRMFGGEIIGTLNDSIVQHSGLNKTTIKIHLIEKKQGEKFVGIELTDNAKLAWSMRPITFSKAEAEQLAGMLNEAISKT